MQDKNKNKLLDSLQLVIYWAGPPAWNHELIWAGPPAWNHKLIWAGPP